MVGGQGEPDQIGPDDGVFPHEPAAGALVPAPAEDRERLHGVAVGLKQKGLRPRRPVALAGADVRQLARGDARRVRAPRRSLRCSLIKDSRPRPRMRL